MDMQRQVEKKEKKREDDTTNKEAGGEVVAASKPGVPTPNYPVHQPPPPPANNNNNYLGGLLHHQLHPAANNPNIGPLHNQAPNNTTDQYLSALRRQYAHNAHNMGARHPPYNTTYNQMQNKQQDLTSLTVQKLLQLQREVQAAKAENHQHLIKSVNEQQQQQQQQQHQQQHYDNICLQAAALSSAPFHAQNNNAGVISNYPHATTTYNFHLQPHGMRKRYGEHDQIQLALSSQAATRSPPQQNNGHFRNPHGGSGNGGGSNAATQLHPGVSIQHQELQPLQADGSNATIQSTNAQQGQFQSLQDANSHFKQLVKSRIHAFERQPDQPAQPTNHPSSTISVGANNLGVSLGTLKPPSQPSYGIAANGKNVQQQSADTSMSKAPLGTPFYTLGDGDSAQRAHTGLCGGSAKVPIIQPFANGIDRQFELTNRNPPSTTTASAPPHIMRPTSETQSTTTHPYSQLQQDLLGHGHGMIQSPDTHSTGISPSHLPTASALTDIFEDDEFSLGAPGVHNVDTNNTAVQHAANKKQYTFLDDNIELGLDVLPEDNVDNNLELVCPEDKRLIAEHLYLVFNQYKICRLTKNDQRSPYKERSIGCPGIACRHCIGQAGKGRYFPPSQSSLRQSSMTSTIINHIKTCRHCPINIRGEIELLLAKDKKKSKEERPKHGGRNKFFHRIWCRMQGDPLPPLESPSQSGPASTPTAQKKCVMDVTRADPKRNNKDDKSEAIDSNNIEPQYRNMDVKTNEETVGTPTPDAKFVTFHCPKCTRDFTLTPRTAAAAFSRHVKACGRGEKETSLSAEGRKDKRKRELPVRQATRVSARKCSKKNQVDTNETKTDMSDASSVLVDLSQSKSNVKMKPNNAETKKRKRKSEGAPIFARSSFQYYTSAMRPQLVKDLSSVEGSRRVGPAETNRILGEKWRALPPKEKKPYEDMATEDKKRYLREKEAFDESVTNNTNDCSNDNGVALVEEAQVSKKKGLKLLCKVETQQFINADLSYTYAPMGNLWLDKSLGTKTKVCDANLRPGHTLLGRQWVWDEAYFVDDHLDPSERSQSFNKDELSEIQLPKDRCTCGSKHMFKLLSTIINKSSQPTNNDEKSSVERSARRSERSATTYTSSVISSQLASGQLDPHTLVACDEYDFGAEFRHVKNMHTEKSVQPFLIRVSPDATFLADLHAHLCDSEIIGLLGGRYSTEEKCIYIQAAFPCKATDRADSGQTDVEMDAIGQIFATEAIMNHGMSIVGWYHSHPDFQPTPSITDIENQASYQKLFQGGDQANRKSQEVSPFVGLIVGTYDGKNPTSQSVMKWFHVQSRDTPERKAVNFPMNLRTTERYYRNMSFDNQSVMDNIRRSMTLRGSDIRHVLESRYLSCPASGVKDPEMKQAIKIYNDRRNKQMKAINEHTDSIENSTEYESEKVKDVEMNIDTPDGQALPPDNKQNDKGSLTLLETGKTPLLLSESMLLDKSSANVNEIWKFQSARPLYFTEKEHSILDMKHDTVPDDVVAGILWFAIEREQQMLPKAIANEHLPSIPASSRSILELLLRQSLISSNSVHRKLYSIIQCLENTAGSTTTDDDTGSTTLNDDDQFAASDATIFHNIDVVLGHYSPKLNRVNPFTSWNGAGDKGSISKDVSESSTSWADYYLTTILRAKSVQTGEGVVYRGGFKIKRGHKIAASLLKSARRMQLDSVDNNSEARAIFPFDDSDYGLNFDHEQSLSNNRKKLAASTSHPQHRTKYKYFVAEVMRLMAARWRECGTRASGRQSTPRKLRGQF